MPKTLPVHPTLVHPHTGRPLQAIGWTKRGQVIWPVMGASPDHPADPGDGQGDPTGAGGDADGKDGKEPDIKGDFDAERAKRAITAAREAEKKAKADAKAANDRTAAILKAAGLTPDGKEDPEAALKAAAADRDAATVKARQTAVELAVYKSAGKAGVDPDTALDSRAFLGAVSDLDPDAADFADKVNSALKAALKANPKLGATTTQGGQGPARQGTDVNGGGNTNTRPTSLGAAVSAAMTPS